MDATEISPEVMRLAKTVVSRAWDTRSRSNAEIWVARIIHDAGTFTPKPVPTRGMVAACEYIEKYMRDAVPFDENSLAALLDTEIEAAGKAAAEEMRERVLDTLNRNRGGDWTYITERLNLIGADIRSLDAGPGTK